MADLQDLLLRTSRTFALSIPRLPEPLRREVRIAYLLFRIADTFEDAAGWPLDLRLQALADFDRLLEEAERGPLPELLSEARRLAGDWTGEPPPSDHEGYLDLLASVPAVLEAHGELPSPARETIARYTSRTARGMAEFLERPAGDGRLQLSDLTELRRYCYVVAGIVGELLTELFLLEEPDLARVAGPIRERAAGFGEALQLVNILKDSSADAREGRSYVPRSLGRRPLFALARRDLEVAEEYVRLLQEGGASDGLLAFTALPVELAWRTLDRVESEGPGAKLTRPEVTEAVAALDARLGAGLPALTRTDEVEARSAPEGGRSR